MSVQYQPWLILFPLLSALVCFAAPRYSRPVGLVCALFCAVIVGIWIQDFEQREVYMVGNWSAPLGIKFLADGLTLWMLGIASVVGVAVSIYSWKYFEKDDARFWPIWLLLVAALNALFLSRDIFNLYVTLELSGLAAVTLAALGDKAESILASLRYFFVSMLGSLSYLLGVVLLYGEYATVDIDLLGESMQGTANSILAAVFMVLGLVLKSALFPFHAWLPAAHANAPAPASALLSSLVVKGSFYILLRLWFEVFPEAIVDKLSLPLGCLASMAIIWGGIQALVQNRVKLIVAYSTVAQVGYLFLVFPLSQAFESIKLAQAGAAYMIMAHALSKTATFFAAGNFISACGSDRLENLKGVGRLVPVSTLAFALAAMSLAGLPPSAGFIGKWQLIMAGISAFQWQWTIVLVVGGLLAACFYFRIFNVAISDVERDCKSVPLSRQWTPMLLALICALLGLMAPSLLEFLQIGDPLSPTQPVEAP